MDRGVVGVLPNREGQHQERRREDRRNHAGRVHAQREIAHRLRLARGPAAACVLDRDPALTSLHEDHEGDRGDDDGAQEDHVQDLVLPGPNQIEDVRDARRETYDDSREDDQRDPVDPALGHLLAQPHDERGSSGQRDHRRETEAPAGLENRTGSELSVLERDRHEEALEERERDRRVARPLGDPLLPFAAFLLKALEGGDHDRQELEDDARGDIGHDAQSEDRELLHRAA